MAARGIGGARLAALPIAWLAGVALQLHERALLREEAYALLAGGALLALSWLALRRRASVASRGPTGVFFAAAGAFVTGFALAGWQASVRIADALPGELEGKDIVVTGVVAGLPQQGASGLRFRFLADPGGAPAGVPRLLALGWYANARDDAAVVQPWQALRAGQRWRLTVRLRRPHGNLNPHGFDHELALFEQGVRATGTVREAPATLLDASAGFPLERMRQRVRDAIYAHVDDRRAAGVLAALAVGDQSAIERDDWDLFRNSGVAHLMSISGLHVTMLAWLAGLAVAALWRRSAGATHLLPAPAAARWGGLLAAAAYALFAGWGVPAQRTVWMLATVTALQSLGLRWPWSLVLLIAAFVVTLLDPWALLQPGFWLSFMAVALLMSSSPASATRRASGEAGEAVAGWRGWPARLAQSVRGGVRTQLIATLGLTPLTLVFFQQVSLVGLAANLVAIPVVTLVITPLALAGSIVAPLWTLAAALVELQSAWLAQLVALPGAVWTVPVAPVWARVAGLLAALLVVLPLPWRARLLAVPLALALLVTPVQRPAEGAFDVIAADVGQGTAVVVRTRTHALLFDTGPQYSPESDAGQRVLVPLLRASGERRLDLLVLSHRDSDHVGGARSVLEAMPVEALSSSLEDGHPLLEGAHGVTRCVAGQRWRWDGVDFAVLHPAREAYLRSARPNAMSCVLRVEGGGRSVLLTGDIEREQESALVVDGAPLRSDVLLAPHHGSKTSSSAAFLDLVHPRVAVFQAGYRNRFGHPAEDVLDRYRERGIAVVTSPACGAWQWSAAGPADGACERELARRYWHARD
jgi:competence protein ComEC